MWQECALKLDHKKIIGFGPNIKKVPLEVLFCFVFNREQLNLGVLMKKKITGNTRMLISFLSETS